MNNHAESTLTRPIGSTLDKVASREGGLGYSRLYNCDLRPHLYGLGYPKQPTLRVTLTEVT